MNQVEINVDNLEEVYLSTGWHDLELLQNFHFRWLFKKAEIIVVPKKEKRYLSVVFVNHFKKKVIAFTIKKTDGTTLCVFNKMCDTGKRYTAKIPLEDVELITFESDSYYCPFEKGDSNDRRKLTVMVLEFIFETPLGIYSKLIQEVTSINEKSYTKLEKETQVVSSTDAYFTSFEKSSIPQIVEGIKHGILLYLPNLKNKHLKTLDNLKNYKHSAHDVPIVVYTDGSLDGSHNYPFTFVKINPLPLMKDGITPVNYKYATWAFFQGIKLAKKLGWKYFFYYEWDCMIGKDYWYDTIWQEHLNWIYEPIMTGTPVFKCPLQGVGNLLQGVQDYRYRYSKECKLYMNVEHVYPFALYTNGALTFYNTEETERYFKNEMEIKNEDASDHMDTITSWDLEIGIRLFKEFGEQSFEKVGWLPSSYSGCGDFYYNEEQRVSMLNSGLKTVIHQYKYI